MLKKWNVYLLGLLIVIILDLCFLPQITKLYSTALHETTSSRALNDIVSIIFMAIGSGCILYVYVFSKTYMVSLYLGLCIGQRQMSMNLALIFVIFFGLLFGMGVSFMLCMRLHIIYGGVFFTIWGIHYLASLFLIRIVNASLNSRQSNCKRVY